MNVPAHASLTGVRPHVSAWFTSENDAVRHEPGVCASVTND
jgi:hypothetical protein